MLISLVKRAQRRVVLNRALWEAALTGAIALLGPTLFVLLGKDFFPWPLFVVFVVAGLAAGAIRMRRQNPGLYEVAQVLDARLKTSDQISTAIYFLDSTEPAVVGQRRAATKLSAQLNVEEAFPFTLPRSFYMLASVLLLASTFVALRFFLDQPLRLERTLPQLLAQAMDREVQQAREKAAKQASAVPIESLGPGYQDQGALPKGPGPSTPELEASSAGAEKGPAQGDEKNSKAPGEGSKAGDEAGDPMAPDSKDAAQPSEEMPEGDAKAGMQNADRKQGKDAAGNENANSSGSNESSGSMLSKLRDAVNNMLSRLQPKAQKAEGKSANGNEQKEGAGDSRNGAGQPKTAGQEASNAEGKEGQSQELSGENSSGKSGGQSHDQGDRKSAGNGAGNQEGDKRVAEALQQEAMGKLSELYGKRAATVTGRVTVETQAGKQTLSTPQSQKQARHADSGGEVSRDEIPLAYQAYIKEYFNKLRQTSPKQ